jgi:hypothetical protein
VDVDHEPSVSDGERAVVAPLEGGLGNHAL